MGRFTFSRCLDQLDLRRPAYFISINFLLARIKDTARYPSISHALNVNKVCVPIFNYSELKIDIQTQKLSNNVAQSDGYQPKIIELRSNLMFQFSISDLQSECFHYLWTIADSLADSTLN